MKVIQDMHLS